MIEKQDWAGFYRSNGISHPPNARAKGRQGIVNARLTVAQGAHRMIELQQRPLNEYWRRLPFCIYFISSSKLAGTIPTK